MDRREFLAVAAASAVAGCTSRVEGNRDCSEIDVRHAPMCSTDEPYVLDVEPKRIEPPATVEFTVVNRDDRDLTVERTFPHVYRKVESGWNEEWPVRRRLESDRVLVEDRHSYEQEMPFGSWDPEPGEHLVVVPGYPDNPGVWRSMVYLGDFVELQP